MTRPAAWALLLAVGVPVVACAEGQLLAQRYAEIAAEQTESPSIRGGGAVQFRHYASACKLYAAYRPGKPQEPALPTLLRADTRLITDLSLLPLAERSCVYELCAGIDRLARLASPEEFRILLKELDADGLMASRLHGDGVLEGARFFRFQAKPAADLPLDAKQAAQAAASGVVSTRSRLTPAERVALWKRAVSERPDGTLVFWRTAGKLHLEQLESQEVWLPYLLQPADWHDAAGATSALAAAKIGAVDPPGEIRLVAAPPSGSGWRLWAAGLLAVAAIALGAARLRPAATVGPRPSRPVIHQPFRE
jgi:hypothetical protein